jgi:hypothetical protein
MKGCKVSRMKKKQKKIKTRTREEDKRDEEVENQIGTTRSIIH